jgi:hypothetical protein
MRWLWLVRVSRVARAVLLGKSYFHSFFSRCWFSAGGSYAPRRNPRQPRGKSPRAWVCGHAAYAAARVEIHHAGCRQLSPVTFADRRGSAGPHTAPGIWRTASSRPLQACQGQKLFSQRTLWLLKIECPEGSPFFSIPKKCQGHKTKGGISHAQEYRHLL